MSDENEYHAPAWDTMEHEAEMFEDFTRMLTAAGVLTSEQGIAVLEAIHARRTEATETGTFTI